MDKTIALYGKEQINKILLKLVPPVMLAQIVRAISLAMEAQRKIIT